MNARPSIVKGHSLKGEPTTTAHIIVVAGQTQWNDFLDQASQWVNAGVLEPAIWVPIEWLDPIADETSDPRGVAIGRDDPAERREVKVLEALAREPHDHLLVTVIAPPPDRAPDPTWRSRIESLIKALDAARPRSRDIDGTPSRGTDLRALNLIFSAADSGNSALRDVLLNSERLSVENLVVNPEDRPTPIAVDTIPRPGTARWVPHVVSSAATISGLWSSMATSPVQPDAQWIVGNVRVVRTFARVVLTYPLVSQVAESAKELLVGDTLPCAEPGVQILPAPMEPMSDAQLHSYFDFYCEWLLKEAGLGYRPTHDFQPPSERRRGFLESLGHFMRFAGDKLTSLPRWLGQAFMGLVNRKATQDLYGQGSGVVVDVRLDLNVRTNDPQLVEAWDFVALQRAELLAALDAPTAPPEESDDPAPWMAIHNGIALFVEGRGNVQHATITNDQGSVLVAARLDDVIPPAGDAFTIDAACDRLLGGDGTARQVSWMDVDGARRLEELIDAILDEVHARVGDLEGTYLATEADFFASQATYLQARHRAEDDEAKRTREIRIAAADLVAPGAHPTHVDALDHDVPSERDPGGAEQPTGVDGFAGEGDADDDDDFEEDEELTPPVNVDFAWRPSPFESPLDAVIAQAADLEDLTRVAAESAEKQEREGRLRSALSDVAAAEQDRVQAARKELEILQRTHTSLGKWIERRSSSLVGKLLYKLDEESRTMKAKEEEVLVAARESEPEIGQRSAELRQRYVLATRNGILIALVLGLIVTIVKSFFLPDMPWWLVATIFIAVLLIAVLGPLVPYFQSWTREMFRAEDARAKLVYQTGLVRHVRSERVRLAQLHMQVPQRIESLGLWWHYWDDPDGSKGPGDTPTLPGLDALPHHLRWARSDWTHSTVFRRLRDDVLASNLRIGYRSALVGEAAKAYGRDLGVEDALSMESLVRMRSTEGLSLVRDWVEDERLRRASNLDLGRRLANEAQAMNRRPDQATARVEVLNSDPLEGLDMATDLLDDPASHELSTNDFLLEIAVPAGEMGHRVWDFGIGVQPFESFFAGPVRLQGFLPNSVTFVDVEATKVCSSEVSVRLDITGQVDASMLRSDRPDDESQEPDGEEEG
jgi:hypothetical protein